MNLVKSMKKQTGLATLVVSVVIMVLMTLIVLFAAKVGVFDQRMAGNETRYKEAFAMAEAGLDYSTQRFASEFARLFDGSNLSTIQANASVANATEPDGTSPESGEGSFTVAVAEVSGASLGSIPVYRFTSTGVSADGSGEATVQREITMASLFGGTTPDVPIIVGGSVGTGGSFNVSTKYNASGVFGIPVSIWADDTGVEITASSATCHPQFYDGNNAQCQNPSGKIENITKGTNPATTLTSYDVSYPDVLPDPNFPDDLFLFMFGIDKGNWQTKYNEVAQKGQVVADCTSIVALGAGAGANYPIWWVTNDTNDDCDLSGTIGSVSQPVILVIDDLAMATAGNTQIYGVVYLFDNPDNADTPSSSLNGTTELVGSFVSDVGGNAMSGSYGVVYDPDVLESLSSSSNGSNFTLTYVPGSWRDF